MLDLHYYYTQFKKQARMSAWLPVDPEIYLAYHNQLARVPCLFEPDNKFKGSPRKKGKKGAKKKPE